MLTFLLPNEQKREEVLAFYEEFEKAGSSCIGFANRKNYDKWLSEMTDRHTGQNLPKGFVRENFYLCYENAALVGVFSLKFELTDYLFRYGGHIGYAVRPSERRRGLATQILKEGLILCKNFGFDRVLCVCDDDNIASEKVIRKNGGVFENELFDPEENCTVKRFWIFLS